MNERLFVAIVFVVAMLAVFGGLTASYLSSGDYRNAALTTLMGLFFTVTPFTRFGRYM